MQHTSEKKEQQFIITIKPYGNNWKLYANKNLVGKYKTKKQALSMSHTMKSSVPEAVIVIKQR